ncbi:MAG: RNA methyltransferase, partial [Clostridia bacterium]|nr:RNA methyltransferase [Clostridia bacterium]
SEEVFRSISTEISPQGVVAVIKKPENDLVMPKSSCLLLDGVADPSNVGAIIRTAAAAGYDTVYMTENSADPFSPKAVRSSMSGVFRVKIVRGSLDQLLSVINLPVLVADMCGESVFNYAPESNFCLVIGNEGHGVSDLLKNRADFTVSIPMQNGVESLNAAVSAGLLMYSLKKF